jgi:membrane protease YdiL (CAAX protease family)
MKYKYVVISSLISCICLYFIEQGIGVNYAVKTLAKLLLFTIVPYVYIKLIKKSDISTELNLKQFDKKRLKLGFLFGLSSFIIVLAGYFLFKGAIDLNSIANDLQEKNITPANFILIGLYITLGNSFLEEFFFRGFIFLNLYNMKKEKLAYIYSSVLFGLYHIAIFKTWFNLSIILLCLLGLITVGFLFNWLNTKSQNFINSWLVHIFADSAIILIGLKMFNII